MKSEQAQRRIIAAALFSTKCVALVPSTYEQLLAEEYIKGSLTIYQSVELLEEYHRRQHYAEVSQVLIGGLGRCA